MAAEPADDHPAAFDRFQIGLAFILAGQELIHIAVVRARQAAGADLHRGGAKGKDLIQGLLERELLKDYGKNTDTHFDLLQKMVAYSASCSRRNFTTI